MNNSIYLLVASALIVGFTLSTHQDEERAHDEEAVKETVQRYFDGIMHYDAEALREAFHPEARLVASLPNGRVYDAPFEQWVQFTERTAPQDLTGYKNTIVSIDIAGNAAVAKTDLDWPTVHYVDYLSLLKIDGAWKIVNKIWHQERK